MLTRIEPTIIPRSRVVAALVKLRKEWQDAAKLFTESGELIIKLCGKALSYDGKACSELLGEIADNEEKGYKLLL